MVFRWTSELVVSPFFGLTSLHSRGRFPPGIYHPLCLIRLVVGSLQKGLVLAVLSRLHRNFFPGLSCFAEVKQLGVFPSLLLVVTSLALFFLML